MPKTPVSQHQSTAPGPPSTTAVETPTMFPVPRVAASVTASAPKPESPFPSFLPPETDSLTDCASLRCGTRRETVIHIWVMSRASKIGQLQRKSVNCSRTERKADNAYHTFIFLQHMRKRAFLYHAVQCFSAFCSAQPRTRFPPCKGTCQTARRSCICSRWTQNISGRAKASRDCRRCR